MAGAMHFTFEAFGETHISREIRSKGERADDIAPALRVVDDMMTGMLKEQFMSEGAAGGAAWHPLAEATVAYKRSHELRPEILRATDRLFLSLTSPGHTDFFALITHDQLHRGSTVPYGPYHQRGNDRLPRRRIFSFREIQKRDIMKVIQRFIMTGEPL